MLQGIKEDGVITKYKYVEKKKTCDMEREEFMTHVSNVAIISDAGSTGISLHACKMRHPDVEQARKRVHITVELGWSAEKVLQQLGRTHRANQHFPPLYYFLFTDIPAEKRFNSIILGRLSMMVTFFYNAIKINFYVQLNHACFKFQSAFTCAQRSNEMNTYLANQAIYESDASVKAIMAAKSYFFDEERDLPIVYDTTGDKAKVREELTSFGLACKQEKKNYFFLSQGKSRKKFHLIQLLNK